MSDVQSLAARLSSGRGTDPTRDTVHRVNLANRATDQAWALMHQDPGDIGAYRLLLRSIEIAPSFVNAYAALAHWIGTNGADALPELMRVWNEHGSRDERAVRFLDQYRRGDPAVHLAELCDRRGWGPSLIVRVGDHIEHLDLYDYDAADSHRPAALIGRVEHPRLVCSPRDFGQLPAAKQVLAEDAVKRGKDFRIVQHRGTSVRIAHRTVFGPAIDSLYYNAALHETVYRSSLATRATHVAEIGVGSGFLLCAALGALRRRPLHLRGSDIDPRAVETTRENVRLTLADLDATGDVDVIVESTPDLLERLPTESIDLLLTNPPYIPERRYVGENAYSGTRVIEAFVAVHAPRILAAGGVAIVLYSSLASAAVEDCLRQTPLVAIPLAAPRRVPLDLREVGSDARWTDLLERDYGLEVTLDDPAHAFWHTLHVIALCRPQDGKIVGELQSLGAANNGSPRTA